MAYTQFVRYADPDPDHILAADFFKRLGWGQVERSVAEMIGLPKNGWRQERGNSSEGIPIYSQRALDAWAARVREFFPGFKLEPRTTAAGIEPRIPTTSSYVAQDVVLSALGWTAAQLENAQLQFHFPQTHLRSPDQWTRPQAFFKGHEVSGWCGLIAALIPDAFTIGRDANHDARATA